MTVHWWTQARNVWLFAFTTYFVFWSLYGIFRPKLSPRTEAWFALSHYLIFLPVVLPALVVLWCLEWATKRKPPRSNK